MIFQNKSIIRAAITSMALTVGAVALAAPTTDPADIVNPTVETFEGYTGVDIPQSGFGPTYGLPPTGFVFDSGLVLTGPSPNTDDGLVIGDNAPYGCCGGGISSPDDIISGTAFAADGNPQGGIQSYDFPTAVSGFGLYFMSDADVTLTAFDGGGGVIETQVFAPQASPLTSASFSGIVSQVPIASFSIESEGFYAYDDLTFSDAAAPPPPPLEPATPVPAMGQISLAVLILLMAGFGIAQSRKF